MNATINTRSEWVKFAAWGVIGLMAVLGWVELALGIIDWTLGTSMYLLFVPILAPLAMRTHWRRIQGAQVS